MATDNPQPWDNCPHCKRRRAYNALEDRIGEVARALMAGHRATLSDTIDASALADMAEAGGLAKVGETAIVAVIVEACAGLAIKYGDREVPADSLLAILARRHIAAQENSNDE